MTLGLWTVALVYNITEVAFKWHFIWVTLLLGRIPVLDRSENGMHTVPAFDGASALEQYAELPLETADLWESSPAWPPERRSQFAGVTPPHPPVGHTWFPPPELSAVHCAIASRFVGGAGPVPCNGCG